MIADPHLDPADPRDALAVVVRALLERQLRGVEVAHCWPEAHRVRIRTATGKQGDVEILVNWDVVVAVAQEGTKQ
jgi:hypothetical protein